MIADFSAFVTVLFTASSLYFMAKNEQKFYQENPEWQNFDKTLK